MTVASVDCIEKGSEESPVGLGEIAGFGGRRMPWRCMRWWMTKVINKTIQKA